MNILLLSTIYPLPGPDNHGTKVCHFFAKEWMKMGHNVQSIHIQAVYPQPLYWIAKFNRKRIAAKTGAVVYTERDRGGSYVMDGVPVTRIPVFKPIPHGAFWRKSVRKAVEQIYKQNTDNGFTPDIILAHFSNPQIEMLSMLKELYPNVKNALIIHGDIALTKKVYGKRLPVLMQDINSWGFRNNGDLRDFQEIIAPVDRHFMCYSGVPEDYLIAENNRKFEGPLKTFIYVGEMIERKYPVQVLEALNKSYPNGDYQMSYVGDGQLISNIKEKASALGVKDKVNVLGRIPREEIKSRYDQADCMVMISRGEVYGLVYLEAMARGCITIASRNEGFDGIIEDGVNGFLCEAGNPDELANIICRINSMTAEERRQISYNAWLTAKGLTDYMAAKKYLDDAINSFKQ